MGYEEEEVTNVYNYDLYPVNKAYLYHPIQHRTNKMS